MSSSKRYVLSFTTLFYNKKGYVLYFNRHKTVTNTDKFPIWFEPWGKYDAIVLTDSKQGTKVKQATSIYSQEVNFKTIFEGTDPAAIVNGSVNHIANISENLSKAMVNVNGDVSPIDKASVNFYDSLRDILDSADIKVVTEDGNIVVPSKGVEVKYGATMKQDLLKLLHLDGADSGTLEYLNLLPHQGYNQTLELVDRIFKTGEGTAPSTQDRMMVIQYGERALDMARADYVRTLISNYIGTLNDGVRVDTSMVGDMAATTSVVNYNKQIEMLDLDGGRSLVWYGDLDLTVDTSTVSVVIGDAVELEGNSKSGMYEIGDYVSAIATFKHAFEGDVVNLSDSEGSSYVYGDTTELADSESSSISQGAITESPTVKISAYHGEVEQVTDPTVINQEGMRLESGDQGYVAASRSFTGIDLIENSSIQVVIRQAVAPTKLSNADANHVIGSEPHSLDKGGEGSIVYSSGADQLDSTTQTVSVDGTLTPIMGSSTSSVKYAQVEGMDVDAEPVRGSETVISGWETMSGLEDTLDTVLGSWEVGNHSQDNLEVSIESGNTFSPIDKVQDTQHEDYVVGVTIEAVHDTEIEVGGSSSLVEITYDSETEDREQSSRVEVIPEVEVGKSDSTTRIEHILDVVTTEEVNSKLRDIVYDVEINDGGLGTFVETIPDVEIEASDQGNRLDRIPDVQIVQSDLADTVPNISDVVINTGDTGAVEEVVVGVDMTNPEKASYSSETDVEIHFGDTAQYSGKEEEVDLVFTDTAETNITEEVVIEEPDFANSDGNVIDTDELFTEVAISGGQEEVVIETPDFAAQSDQTHELIVEGTVFATNEGTSREVVLEDIEVATTETFHDVVLEDFDPATRGRGRGRDIEINHEEVAAKERGDLIDIEEDDEATKGRGKSIVIDGDDLADKGRGRSITIDTDELVDKGRGSLIVIEDDEDSTLGGEKLIGIYEEEEGTLGGLTIMNIAEEDSADANSSTLITIGEEEGSEKTNTKGIVIENDSEGKRKKDFTITVTGEEEVERLREFDVNIEEEDSGKRERVLPADPDPDDDLGVGLQPPTPPWEEPPEKKSKIWLVMGKQYPAWNNWNPKKTR